MEPTLQNNLGNPSNNSRKILFVVGGVLIVGALLIGIFYFLKERRADLENARTKAEEALQAELRKPAPVYSSQTVESIRAELAKPPTIGSGGGLSEQEIERIRQELRK